MLGNLRDSIIIFLHVYLRDLNVSDQNLVYLLGFGIVQELFLDKKTDHIRNITFKGESNNNKMERLNGEIRDREKVMRSLKRVDSPILSGMQIHHNFIRSHMALDGKTPSDMAGIKIEGDNKWITLIQNASKK